MMPWLSGVRGGAGANRQCARADERTSGGRPPALQDVTARSGDTSLALQRWNSRGGFVPLQFVNDSLNAGVVDAGWQTVAWSRGLHSPGAVLYRSLRVGKKGYSFVCYKLRTMIAEADQLREELRARNERHGPFFKIENDPRVTRLGRWLRRYSLDELPQFWNVLKGEMSLVGPRPHPMPDFAGYQTEHLRRLNVTPGITGLWQITARKDPSFERNMALDLEYIEHWSLWLDLKILLKTAPILLGGTGS